MLHVVFETDAPTTAPTEIGQHWFDVTNKKSYISVGTDDVDDWKETTSSGITGSEYTGSNLGSGVAVFAQLDGTDFQFRTIEAGPNIGIEVVGDTILISGTASVSGTVSGTGSDVGALGVFGNNPSSEVTAEGWVKADGSTVDGSLYPDAVRRRVLTMLDSGRWAANLATTTYDLNRDRFIACDYQEKLAYSDDRGQTWTLLNEGTVYLNGFKVIVLPNGDYLAVGFSVEGDGRCAMYSLDGGDSWSECAAFDPTVYFLSYPSSHVIIGDQLLVCGVEGNMARVFYYDISGGDYTGAWTSIALPDFPNALAGQANVILYDVTHARLMAIGRTNRNSGAYWTAPISDITAWTAGDDPLIQGTPATITVSCTDNFVDGESIQLWNPLTFMDSPSDPFHVQIGATLEDTLNNLAAMIQDGILYDSGFYTSTHDATSITLETWNASYAESYTGITVNAANATAGPTVGGSGPYELYDAVFDLNQGAIVITNLRYNQAQDRNWLVVYYSTGSSFSSVETPQLIDENYRDNGFWLVDGRYYFRLRDNSDLFLKLTSTTFGNFDNWTVHDFDFFSYADPDAVDSAYPISLMNTGLEKYFYASYGKGFVAEDLTGSFEVLPHIGVPATYGVPNMGGNFYIKLL